MGTSHNFSTLFFNRLDCTTNLNQGHFAFPVIVLENLCHRIETELT